MYFCNMKRIDYTRIIIICILGLVSELSLFARSLEPNKLMLDTIISVIDTIPALEEFKAIKPSIIQDIETLQSKRNICQSMLSSNRKKTKTNEEKAILVEAYEYAINNSLTDGYEYSVSTYRVLFGGNPHIKHSIREDVKKGKLTDTLRNILSQFNQHLLGRISMMNLALEYSWTSFLENPPMKQITIKVENPNYRGYHYDDYYTLNKIEQDRLLGEYSFVLSDGGVHKKETYPIEVSYLRFPQLPNHKVIDNYCMEIYDNNGQLAYVPILKRQSNTELIPKLISKEIMRLVYLQDYQNNKYNIRSANQNTHNFLSLWIGRKHGLSKSASELDELNTEGYFRGMGGLLGTNATRANEARCREIIAQTERYKDDAGERYLKQLEFDHTDDFAYIYAIERLSDISFEIIYLNKTSLQPSVCAIVTFSTGGIPYTSTFTVQLKELPNTVPQIIRH